MAETRSNNPSAVSALKAIMSRLPLTESDQEKAARLISSCSLEDLQSLGLGPPLRPCLAKGAEKMQPQQRLHAVQRVISSLQYNHQPGYFFNVAKDRPWSRIMDTARDALAAALPIKCIEAVFLGAYMTTGWTDLDRIPIGFKSKSDGQIHRHIVLVVRHFPSSKFGALGISRRGELMDKELCFDSLGDVLTDYKRAYEKWGHRLLKVYVGLPLEHDLLHNGSACWRYLHLNAARHRWSKCCTQLEVFEVNARRLAAKLRIQGAVPPPSSLTQHTAPAPVLQGSEVSSISTASLGEASVGADTLKALDKGDDGNLRSNRNYNNTRALGNAAEAKDVARRSFSTPRSFGSGSTRLRCLDEQGRELLSSSMTHQGSLNRSLGGGSPGRLLGAVGRSLTGSATGLSGTFGSPLRGSTNNLALFASPGRVRHATAEASSSDDVPEEEDDEGDDADDDYYYY